MADGLIDMIIPSADFDALTATSKQVAQGKSYIGVGGASGIGENPVREAPYLSLPVNGEILLPNGIYTGGTVGQKIPTMGVTHVTPISKEISIPTEDKYITDVIYIDPLANLRPENIKEGEYVGGVGPGTWKGFVVTDPNTFYYRGTFAPEQKIEEYARHPEDSNYVLRRIDTDREIEFYRDKAEGSILVFSNQIDLTSLKKLKISIMFVDNPAMQTHLRYLGVRLYRNKTTTFHDVDKEDEPPILNKEYFSSDFKDKIQKNIEIDVSDLSRTAYLSFDVSMDHKGYVYLRIVQFE